MKRIINGSIITLSAILIGFVMIFSILPDFTLNSVITIAGFAIPILIIIVTMIIQIKKSKDRQDRYKFSFICTNGSFCSYFI